MSQRQVEHPQVTGALREARLRGMIGLQPQGQGKGSRRLAEQAGIAGDNQVRGVVRLRQHDAGVRTDAGRLAGGDDDPREMHYILISMNASSRRRLSHSSVSSSALLSRIAANAF